MVSWVGIGTQWIKLSLGTSVSHFVVLIQLLDTPLLSRLPAHVSWETAHDYSTA